MLKTIRPLVLSILVIAIPLHSTLAQVAPTLGVTRSNLNPFQIATLHWYDANLSASFSVGSGPSGVVFDGGNIWVTNAGSNTVTKIRANDGEVLGTFALGGSPGGIAFDGSSIWVVISSTGTLTKLRASDGVASGTFALGVGLAEVAFDGANIWVTNYLNYTVTKLRAIDGTVLGTFAVGACAHRHSVRRDERLGDELQQ